MLLLLLKNGQWDVCTGRRCSAKETVSGSSPNFCCPGKSYGLNRIGHPDWVKWCVELNCAPNQNNNCYNSIDSYFNKNLCCLILVHSYMHWAPSFKQTLNPELRVEWKISLTISGIVGRVFANGPGDLSSIAGRVIPKTLKMVLDTSLLNSQQYKVCIKSNPRKGVAPSPTTRCSSNCKGSLRVTPNYGGQLYLLTSVNWFHCLFSIIYLVGSPL